MFISWDGLATVVRGVSSVIFAEILLAYLMHGYSDMVTIYIIIFISSLLMLLGSCVTKNKGASMEQIWNDFFTEQNIYVLTIGGLYLLIFGFGKFMEIRQDNKKAQTIKKAKCHQCAIKEAQRENSELSKMPPFLG